MNLCTLISMDMVVVFLLDFIFSFQCTIYVPFILLKMHLLIFPTKLDPMEGEGKGGAVWTASQSNFMQVFLANLVADGIKTSTGGFKRVHLNACAKALNEHFKLNRTAEQISKHLKTVKKKYVRINQLRAESGSGWDEDLFMVTMDHEQYTTHFANDKNKGDDEYINKPLPYYGNLATIYGNSTATGRFVKTSNDPLGVDELNTQKEMENIGTPTNGLNDKEGSPPKRDEGGSSRPSKRAKKDECGADPLVQAFQSGAETIANAIEKAAASKGLPNGLFEAVDSLPGFELEHKSRYYSHMLGDPNLANGFMNVPVLYKITMVTDFMNKNM